MMKKILSILILTAMLIGFGFSAFAAPERRAYAAQPAEIGSQVYGFTLKEKRDFPMIGAEVYRFEHDKSGAELVYLANSDTNRVFDLTFFTQATDNSGLAHVFEHAALKGSEKYPDAGLFFHLLYQTYNTYMNAETGPAYTTYPVSSLSEAQLLAYADFYTDSCLHPRVLEDESLFREEAWRYRLEDADAPLTIEGTVYSEMQAASSLFQNSYYNFLRAAFPGSVCGNVSGGEPEHIPDMTWQTLKEYHARFYHPSNCTAYLYGKYEDYTAFLKLLDEAFSAYDRRDFERADEGWQPIKGDVTKRFTFPVEMESSTENESDLYYAFLCPGLHDDPAEELLINTLTDLLGAETSPVMLRLREALPAAFLSTWISLGTPEDAILFNVSGINAEDADTARKAIDQGLAEIAKDGFSAELVDTISAGLDMNMRLSRENTALGLSLLTGQMIPYYAESGRVFDFLDYAEALRKLNAWNQAGEYQRAVSEWLLGCKTHVITVTSPEPGLREELDAAETERLAAVKAAMSPAEIAALLESDDGSEADEDETDYVSQLQAVTVQSLPEEMRRYKIVEEKDADGVHRLEAKADVDGVGMPVILLDAAWVPQEDLHWFVLYLSLLGQLDTADHTADELQVLTGRYLYGAEIRQSLIDEFGTKNFHPWLRAGWLSSDEDLEKGYELLYELLFKTSFRDTDTLSGLIERNKTGMKSLIGYSAYNTMMYRELGADNPLYAYYSYCNGLDYYAFLEQLCLQMEEDPSAVTEKLEEMQRAFCNRTNAVAIFAGPANMIKLNRSLSGRFLEKLDERPVESVEYAFAKPAAFEALVVDETVQYNGLVGSFEDMGLAGYSAELDAVASLITDHVLIPSLREEYGVYTPMHYYDNFAGTYLITYRDPNVEETFAVYDALPELLAAEEIDQETLDGYILSCYSAYAMSEGELSGAVAALTSHLCGEPEDLQIRRMEELKALTPARVRELTEAYRKLAENGQRFTVGSESAVSEHAELYDVILRPFRNDAE